MQIERPRRKETHHNRKEEGGRRDLKHQHHSNTSVKSAACAMTAADVGMRGQGHVGSSLGAQQQDHDDDEDAYSSDDGSMKVII